MNDTVAYGDSGALDVVNATARCVLTMIANSSVLQNGSALCPPDADDDVTVNTRSRAVVCEEGPGYVSWLGDIVLLPPVIVFGVIGNILSFVVLCLQKTNVITTILLRFLAVVDTLILLAAIPLRFLHQVYLCYDVMDNYNAIYAYYIFRFGFPCLYILRTAGTWTTTLLTVDRYIAVCKPLHAQHLVTARLATLQLIFVAFGSVVISLPNFFEAHFVKEGEHDKYTLRDYAKSTWYVIGYKIVTIFLIMYIVPIVIMVVFNVLLMRNLRVAAKDRAALQRSVSSDAKLNSSITNIVIAVVLVFLVCNTMPFISHTLWSLEKIDTSLYTRLEVVRRYCSQFSNIFVTINSAVNFLIYCVCCRGFRLTFMQLICRRRVKKKSAAATLSARVSSGSGHTYFSLLENGHRKVVRDNNSLLGARESNNL